MRPWNKDRFKHVDWWFERQITITSLTGAGSSSTLEAFRRKYIGKSNMKFLSAGNVVAEFAERLGMDREAFTEYMKKHPEERHDERIDATQQRWGDNNNIVFESRLAHLWGPRGCNILQVCDLPTRAKRRARQLGISEKEALELIVKRDSINMHRFDRLYPGWDWPRDSYAGVVDSGREGNTSEVLVEQIELIHKKWLERIPESKIRKLAYAP